jgi:hypothetical protein
MALSAMDRELVEDALEQIDGSITLSSPKGTLEDVVEVNGRSNVPSGVTRAIAHLDDGDREAAKAELRRVIE